MGTIIVDHTVADENIQDVTFSVNLRKSRLDDSGLDPESVALYRGETTQWNRLPTTVVKETDSQYTFEAISPRLSTFIIGAVSVADQQPASSTDSNTTDTPDEPATTADNSPGFDAGLTVITMLVGTLTARQVSYWWRRTLTRLKNGDLLLQPRQ
ncbi:PGF-pre-PGF domain-containing protein [Halohasta litorea]|uniref:PGF-pre-PGF domain-containing protein n=1 Tax=Halohasta litorea TaxID=869891 RepID=A0ABD6DGD7_9EURY|nr:PGF-pre-PGF domain-containing protein [Halohasta litorea]